MRRLLPHPWLSVLLLIIWMLIVRQVSLGNLLLGVVIALSIPWLTSPVWPEQLRIRHPLALFTYALIVLYDVFRSNITVARIVLFMPARDIQTRWITVPLDIRSPEGIAVLGGTITMTPGTVTADISTCGRALLIHTLHAPDPGAVVAEIKSRYEARLMRIFE